MTTILYLAELFAVLYVCYWAFLNDQSEGLPLIGFLKMGSLPEVLAKRRSSLHATWKRPLSGHVQLAHDEPEELAPAWKRQSPHFNASGTARKAPWKRTSRGAKR